SATRRWPRMYARPCPARLTRSAPRTHEEGQTMRFSLPGRLVLPLLAVTGLAVTAAAEMYRPGPEDAAALDPPAPAASLATAAPAAPSEAALKAQWPPQQRRRLPSASSLPPHSFYFTRAAYSGGGRGWQRIN